MKKVRKVKPLQLSKETLHQLDPEEAQKAAGGICLSGTTSCPGTTGTCCYLF
jgi:hypothetical protein